MITVVIRHKIMGLEAGVAYPDAMISSAQIRAARAYLDWTQEDLAQKAGCRCLHDQAC